MATHNDLGKAGEELAVSFLKTSGYEILETNWVYQKAEIDIIAKIENTLAVIEVKTRSNIGFGLPQDFVNTKKIRLMVKAVDEYVTSNELDVDTRFDIIAVYKDGSGFEVEHLKDAFYHF